MKFIFLLLPLFLSSAVLSNGTDPANKTTQDALNDRNQIEDIVKHDPKTAEVDKAVNDLTGSAESTKELYSISADILPVLMEMKKDDPEKALESLASYSKNPEAFLKQLPADTRLKIEKLAKKIEVKKGVSDKTKNKP